MRERGMAVDLKTESGDTAVISAAGAVPDARGRFGQFGGKYAPETLMPALDELESAYAEARRDPKFQDVVDRLARDYVGRPTPLYFARNLTDLGGGGKIWRTPARTRSTTRSAKVSLPNGWASNGSSPRPAPVNTAWRRPPSAPCSVSSASSTWARSISPGSRRMSFA